MFNLLPYEEKIALLKEYRTRRLVIVAFFFIFTLVVAAVLLFPSYLVSKLNNKNVSTSLIQLQEQLKNETSLVASPEEIALLREKISVLNASKDSLSVYTLFSHVIINTNQLIKLNSLGFTRSESDDPSTIILSGNAATRDALTQFARDLEAETVFATVDLPISNLAKDSNIEFTLTVEVRSEQTES